MLLGRGTATILPKNTAAVIFQKSAIHLPHFVKIDPVSEQIHLEKFPTLLKHWSPINRNGRNNKPTD